MQRRDIPVIVSGTTIAAGIVLPLLALLPFGWLWLWQHGLVWYWLAGALLVSASMFAVRLWALHRIGELGPLQRNEAEKQSSSIAPREAEAWRAVEEIADAIDPQTLDSREAVLAIARKTVEAVAQQMHPGVQDPIWKFTVPEALMLVETVSRRIRPLLADNIPLGDRLTIGQTIRIYRWRHLLGKAEKAYNIWRILRLINPVAAVAQETRERLSKIAYKGLREELAKRIARIFVREVGRAAIELYSGRMRPIDPATAGGNRDAAALDKNAAVRPVEPLRLLIAGQTGVGKSSLVNALSSQLQAAVDVLPTTQDFTAYSIANDAELPLVLIDSPGIDGFEDIDRISAAAANCDVLIWVAAANRADRALDRAALAAVRNRFIEMPNRQPPPFVLVVTSIDRLRPFQEWSPPYNVADPAKPKERAIRDAMDAIGADLGFLEKDIVPVGLPALADAYNVDVLHSKLIEQLPAAKSANLLRQTASAVESFDWQKLLSQARQAGRVVSALLHDR